MIDHQLHILKTHFLLNRKKKTYPRTQSTIHKKKHTWYSLLLFCQTTTSRIRHRPRHRYSHRHRHRHRPTFRVVRRFLIIGVLWVIFSYYRCTKSYSKCLPTIFCSVWFLATIAFVHCWSTTYPRVNLALRASLPLKYVPIRILWRPTPNHEPSIPIQASLSERMNSSSSSSTRDTSTCSRLFTHCTTPSWRFCT